DAAEDHGEGAQEWCGRRGLRHARAGQDRRDLDLQLDEHAESDQEGWDQPDLERVLLDDERGGEARLGVLHQVQTQGVRDGHRALGRDGADAGLARTAMRGPRSAIFSAFVSRGSGGSMERRELIASLEESQARYNEIARIEPSLHPRAYGPGKWTARQILA